MKKLKSFINLLCIVLGTIAMPMAVRAADGPASALPVTGTFESTDGTQNFKSFVVDAPSAGSYYAEFWVLPAKHPDASYTRFAVYVNDQYIGDIAPERGSWQAAKVKNCETISLNKGQNIVSLATDSPESPTVETVKIAELEADAEISSVAYENYLRAAAASASYSVPQQTLNSSRKSAAAYPANQLIYSDVPLKYSFYKIVDFKRGDNIILSSRSSAPHVLDVVYYGTPLTYVGPTPPFYPIQTNTQDVSIRNKMLNYIICTSEEMQTHTWTASSIQNNDGLYIIQKHITVPKAGGYLIRLRTAQNGTMALANLALNLNSYENVPISYSSVASPMPADGYQYATCTLVQNQTDDPIIFVQGGGDGRIVGFNDDAPIDKKEYHELSTLDSYICQKYSVPTSRVSVSCYSSLNPESVCDIATRYYEPEDSPSQQMQSTRMQAPARQTSECEVSMPTSLDLCSTLDVAAESPIYKVSAFNISGTCIGVVPGNDCSAKILLSSLNIHRRGVYLISIETSDGVSTRKVMVK